MMLFSQRMNDFDLILSVNRLDLSGNRYFYNLIQ
jgi:hypothetical protein